MRKVILFLTSLVVASFSFAQTKVDCGSSAYSYNPNVKRNCETFQQSTQQARDSLQDKISESVLNVKKMAPPSSSTTAKTAAPAQAPEETSTEEPAQTNPPQSSTPPPPASSGTSSQPSTQTPSNNTFKYY